jgi:aryl-alcohol dehydrogenase-like predicted oxidoreductase
MVYWQPGDKPNDRGLSRKHITESLHASLRRLQTDYVDLYQLHGPDPTTPIDETLRAFDDLVRSGKVRYVGASNARAWPLAQSLWTSDRLGLTRYDCLQPRYNLLYREIEAELLPLCRDEGLGVIPYNPLAGGFLSGKYRREEGPVEGTRFTLGAAGPMYQGRYWHDASFDAVENLKAYFEPRGLPLARVAVAWVLQQPGITSAIVGASRPQQLEDTLASTDVTFDQEALAVLDDVWYQIPRARPGTPAAR